MKQRKLCQGHFGKIYALDWGPDSEKLVSAAQDGKLIIWNAMLEAMTHVVTLRSAWVMSCAYSPDGRMVASGGLDNTCSIFQIDEAEAQTSSTTFELQQHEGYLSCAQFLSSDEILTSSGDATAMLWDIPTQTVKQVFEGHETDVMAVDVSKDKNFFISTSCDAKAKLWDFRVGGDAIKTFIGHESDVNSVKFFPNGHVFGTVSDDSTCRLFDIRSYGQLNLFRDDRIICGITSCDFSHSGRVMFAGYDDYQLYWWDTLTGEKIHQVDADDNRISCLGVNSEGNALATGSWTTRVKIWA